MLDFLKSRQPMPPDHEITESECLIFTQAISHFRNTISDSCVPLFIFSVSEYTTLGMYESISDVLINQNIECVKKYLKIGIETGNDAVKTRCCWWALDISAWDLSAVIEPLIGSSNIEVHEAAENFIQLKSELSKI